MRIIDAEDPKLLRKLKFIREAEYQIYGSGSWGFTAKCEHAIEDAPTVNSQSNWIPVKQELPQDDTIVLVCGKNGGIYTAIYNNSKAWVKGWWKMNSKNHHCNPIAWMPLPEPFKGVAE